MVDVKKINRGLILYLIYQNKGLSRKALAAKTGLTPAAITLIIGDMLREGFWWKPIRFTMGTAWGGRKLF